MRKKSKFGVWSAILGLVLSTGCGKPIDSMEPKDGPASKDAVADESAAGVSGGPLGFQIFRSLLPSGRPKVESLDSGASQDYLWDGRQLQLNAALAVNDSGPAMSWPERAFGEPITELSFSHQVEGIDGQAHGQGRRYLGSFDDRTRLWYIPLAQALRGLGGNPSPADTQRIWLRFIAGGRQHEIIVRFRAYPAGGAK